MRTGFAYPQRLRFALRGAGEALHDTVSLPDNETWFRFAARTSSVQGGHQRRFAALI
ncbi:hypothetical protein FOHLNKBM_4424 [Methylobacterium longum]|jgi:hypothetical protein|nr:hypothetical protein FOHLNKBM_4424 [Methylobacterium longum]